MKQIGCSNIYAGFSSLRIIAALAISGVLWLTVAHDLIHDHEHAHEIPQHGESSSEYPDEEEADCTWCYSGFTNHVDDTVMGYYSPITYVAVGLAEIFVINKTDQLFPARGPPFMNA